MMYEIDPVIAMIFDYNQQVDEDTICDAKLGCSGNNQEEQTCFWFVYTLPLTSSCLLCMILDYMYLYLLVLLANANALKLSCELLKSFVSGHVSIHVCILGN